MDKEQLEIRIKELGVLIEEASGSVKKLVDEQNTLTQDLEDLDKPKLTEDQWDKVDNAVTMACEAFDVDIDDCEYELELDYDNRIQINHFDWSRQQEDLANHIMERLGEMFGTVKNEE